MLWLIAYDYQYTWTCPWIPDNKLKTIERNQQMEKAVIVLCQMCKEIKKSPNLKNLNKCFWFLFFCLFWTKWIAMNLQVLKVRRLTNFPTQNEPSLLARGQNYIFFRYCFAISKNESLHLFRNLSKVHGKSFELSHLNKYEQFLFFCLFCTVCI